MTQALALLLLVARPVDPTASLQAALTGSWVGTLEYRDFSDDSRERLSTLLRVYKPKQGTGLVFRYVFDDGPTKVIQEQTSVQIDAHAKTYTVLPEDAKDKTVYMVEGFDDLKPDGTGTVTLMGVGIESGKPVDVRETLTLTATTFRLLRETRLPGKEFQFRHVYDFTRVVQPTR